MSGEESRASTQDEEQGLDQLYRDVLFEHYRRPHNKGELPGAQIVTKGTNPLCGDRVVIYGRVGADGKLERVCFDGKGCAICIASCSMMTEAVRGKNLTQAEELAGRFKSMMRAEAPFEVPVDVPDMEALEGVKKFPVRVKCATLAWTTLRNGILAYRAGQAAAETNEEKDGA
jgi:nitrogen fixation protein NifU and related proteins